MQPPTLLHTITGTAVSSSGNLPPLSQLAFALSARVMTWELRARTRKSLVRMTIDELADIGLTATEARREAGRFFWQG